MCRLGLLSETELQDLIQGLSQDGIIRADRQTCCRDPEAWHFICPLCSRNCIIHVCETEPDADWHSKIAIEVMCPKATNCVLIHIPPSEFDPHDFDLCSACIAQYGFCIIGYRL